MEKIINGIVEQFNNNSDIKTIDADIQINPNDMDVVVWTAKFTVTGTTERHETQGK